MIIEKINELSRFLRNYGQHFPLGLKMIFAISCNLICVHGVLKRGGGPVVILYVGRRKNLSYLLSMLFDEYSIRESIQSTLLTFRRHMRRMSAQADVEIVDIGWPYHGLVNRRGTYLELPDWVSMAVDLQDSWENVVDNFRHTARNNDLRLIRRNAYRCASSRDRETIERFYSDMYLPFVESRHAADAIVTARRIILRRAQQGSLLQVLKGDDIVAAGVVYPEGDVLYFLWMGMPRRYIDNPPEAAVSALYFYGLRHAFCQGLRAVDFMGSRAFLADGALRFKRKWGALIDDSFSPSSILIRPKDGNRNAAQFCHDVPMLVRRGDILEALLLRFGDAVDEAKFEEIEARFGCAGIDRMTVINISVQDDTQTMDFPGDRCDNRLIQCGLENFAEHYRRLPASTRMP